MDVDMFLHVATQQNIETLVKRGVKIIDPNSGELASGLVSIGGIAVYYLILYLCRNHLAEGYVFYIRK